MKDFTNLKFHLVTTNEGLMKSFFVRGVVFIEEQKCKFNEEFDEFELLSSHFIGTINEEPIAAARIRLFKDYVKIERLAVRAEYRRKGIGEKFLAYILSYIDELQYSKIILHAQSYLTDFYKKFGFVKKGDKFLEVNIEHYYMERISG